MLLQASTHSSNFDENTDNTSLSLTIVAYQWGWSYFLPADALRVFDLSDTRIWANAPTVRSRVGLGLGDVFTPGCELRASCDVS